MFQQGNGTRMPTIYKNPQCREKLRSAPPQSHFPALSAHASSPWLYASKQLTE